MIRALRLRVLSAGLWLLRIRIYFLRMESLWSLRVYLRLMTAHFELEEQLIEARARA